MEDCGWIALSRNIRKHWLWQHPDKLHAWIDLLMLANFEDRKLLIDNKLEVIPRGSFITSELKLAERWKWSRNKIRQFLAILQSDEMIIYFGNKIGTTIKILNYEKYQIVTNSKITEKDNEKYSIKTPEGTPEGTQNNNYNNITICRVREKSNFKVRLSEIELQELYRNHGKETIDQAIKFLTHWVCEDETGSRAKQFQNKNHYHALNRWVITAVKEKSEREKTRGNQKTKQETNKQKFNELYRKALLEEQNETN